MLAGQGAAPSKEQAEDAAAFKEFSARVQAYVQLQKTVKSGLPALKPTDLPEMIAAYQQALARKIREARPHAKPGDVFTSAACEAFRHASRAALRGPALGRLARVHGARTRPTRPCALDGERDLPGHRADHGVSRLRCWRHFRRCPPEVAYRIVGRTLIVIDVESRLIVDVARRVLPPA